MIKAKSEKLSQEEREIKDLKEELLKLQTELINQEKSKRLRDWFLTIAVGLAATFVVVVTTVASKH